MKRVTLFSLIVATLISIVLIASLLIYSLAPDEPKAGQKPFFVGVTYGGNTIAEAKLLIDRVKNYTNLFILQSGNLQDEPGKMVEICDYAVTSGLHVVGYFGALDYNKGHVQFFVDTARERWGSHFLGLCYGDEPGGKMLDSNLVLLRNNGFDENITRQPDSVMVRKLDGTRISYATRNGKSSIELTYSNNTHAVYIENKQNHTITIIAGESTTYSFNPNGTITKNSKGNTTLLENANEEIQLKDYEELLAARPFQTYDETADRLVDHCQSTTEWLQNQSVPLFTADYGLYWFDYLGGYDVVLAEFGWNNTIAQEIGLVRGAATMQNKTWGAIITWKYTTEPYLASGDEIYQQMKTAYEAGAEYAVIFNYPAIEGNPYGIMLEEHFQALERFWNEVVQNPDIENGKVEAEAALVLPKNYGWGMRNSNDTIWGMWRPDEKSQQVWNALQNALVTYGAKLDIVYDDPAYPLAGKYPQILYWNR